MIKNSPGKVLESNSNFAVANPDQTLQQTVQLNLYLFLSTQDIILDQQDILDFYSLLCGTSIRKTKSTFDNDEEEEDDDEENPVETEFDCKLQFEHQSLEGLYFVAVVVVDQKFIP